MEYHLENYYSDEDYHGIPQSFSDKIFRNALEHVRLRTYCSQSITVTFTAM